MKAILKDADQSLRWDDVPDSVAGLDEGLVKVHAVLPITRAEEAQAILTGGYKAWAKQSWSYERLHPAMLRG